jgi:RNA polymerase sigma-70 factor (ECF subfamily)
MTTGNVNGNELLPHLFRTEYTKMTAVLCRLFGITHIEIAEDIASETFLKATEIWSRKGIPANPVAWLYTVAKNKTKDYLKHTVLFDKKISPALQAVAETQHEASIDFTDTNIKDSQLAMIFAVCDPANSAEAQICLALQILCGFSVEEIANALLSNKETIKKRLQRARETLRNQQFKIDALRENEIHARLDTVLTTIYLLFNEGYFSTSGDSLIRKDLCAEAIRLGICLAENTLTNTPPVNALIALMYFQSSRFEARINDSEEIVLFDEQDRNLWDKDLMNKGNYYMTMSATGEELSKYHLEAAIAYWHTTASDEKWNYILQLYDQLLSVEYSPGRALNRIFAYAKVRGHEAAIEQALLLDVEDSHYYQSLLGYLYTGVDTIKAIEHYKQSILLTRSDVERKQLQKAVAKLEG